LGNSSITPPPAQSPVRQRRGSSIPRVESRQTVLHRQALGTRRAVLFHQVPPRGIEPLPQAPEACVISISPRGRGWPAITCPLRRPPRRSFSSRRAAPRRARAGQHVEQLPVQRPVRRGCLLATEAMRTAREIADAAAGLL